MHGFPLDQWVFGRIRFPEHEEYREFQYKLLCIVLLAGALFTGLFVAGEWSRINPLNGSPHLLSMGVFSLLALLLWGILRGHQQRFRTIAWVYEAACLLEYISALVFVPQDELRVLWFFTNISGVYILLGQRAGASITTACVLGLVAGNRYLSAPYSPNAVATLVVAMLYQGVFFHVFANRSISYFKRLRDSRAALHHLATHDPLTGVLNARAYDSVCDHLIQLARRHSTPFSVLFVDLDHFKAVNDTHGHAAGDIVLKAVATTLAHKLRASDALGRIGGEEFSIFMPNTDLAGALQLGETLRQAIEAALPVIPTGPLRITASIGVAESRTGQQSMREIQRLADQAMYDAKARGRNRVSTLRPAGVPEIRDAVPG